MSVSFSFISPLIRLSSKTSVLQPADRGEVEKRYRFGTQIPPTQNFGEIHSHDSRVVGALRVIDNFNSEPMFPGNGFILFNGTGRLIMKGKSLSPIEAAHDLWKGKPIMLRLARIRPVTTADSPRQVQIHPINDFHYHIESSENFITWWQRVGRNFCDGIF